MRRIVLTLLVVMLVGAFGYLLTKIIWTSDIHFAVLPVTGSDVRVLPPIPYASEGANILSELQTRPAVFDLQEIQTSQGFSTLASKLSEGLKREDILIVYLTCHCLSDVDQDGPAAWLLCSNFADRLNENGPESKPEGRYRLHDVLQELKECKAKTKLLLLDSGYLNYDPRLAVFVNEFPRLLEEDVRAIDDPDLWVLCSCRPMEISHVCAAEKRSVFNYFVTEAFTGAANRNNRWVELEDFFTYVRQGVADWVDRQSGGADTQTPWLIHWSGVDHPPRDLRLVPVLTRKPPSPEDEAGSSPAAAAPAGKPSPATVLATSLAEVWQRRDRLQDRLHGQAKARPGWTPVDYAPHLWREYQELALGYDRRSRAGVAFDATGLAKDVAENLSLDERLFSDSASPSGEARTAVGSSTGDPTVASRLMEARRQFLSRVQSDSYFVDANPVRDAIQWKNDLVFRAPYYVRLYVTASRASSGHGPLDQELVKLDLELDKLLSSLAVLIDRLEQWHAAGSPALAKQIEDQIADQVAALKDSDRGIKQVMDDKVKTLEQHPDLTAIDILLDTPLLAAPDRKRLLAARDRIAEALPGDLSKKTPRPPSLGLWSNSIRRQAELERQLALLANPELRFPSLDDMNLPAGKTPTESQFWQTYRKFGQELGGFYRSLPRSIRKELASHDSSAGNRCDRYLRLVDARDAGPESIPDDVLSVVLPHRRTITPPSLAIGVDGADSPLAADADGWYTIKLLVDKTNLPATSGRVTFEYPRDKLVLTSSDGKQPLDSEEPVRVDLRPDHAQFIFKAHARVQTGNETTVKISVLCGGKFKPCDVRLALPQPDVVALQVYRLAGKLDGSTDRRPENELILRFDSLTAQRLGPFPNRPTTYSFELVNRSGLGKKLKVLVYSLPKSFGERNSSCRDACEMLRSGNSGSLLGEANVDLSQLGKSQRLAFPAFKAPPSKKADDKATEKPEAKEPSAKAKGDVTQGLALVFCDAKSKDLEPRWIQVFDLSPLQPGQYMESKPDYDSVKGELKIDVAISDGRDFPPCSLKEPIHVTMTIRTDVGPDGNELPQASTNLNGKFSASLYPSKSHDTLYAPIPSDGRFRHIELDVDDYPRAFLYDVGLHKVTERGDLWRIQFTYPPRHPELALQPCKSLPVKFQVDAPSFFSGGEHPVPAEIWLDAFDEQHPQTAPRPLRFYSDRQVQADLLESDSDSEIKVFAAAKDFEKPVDVDGLKDAYVTIHAQLRQNGLPKGEEDSRRVLLDGTKPEFEVSVPDKVTKGSGIKVIATVTHKLSELSKFEFGFLGVAENKFKDDKSMLVKNPGLSASASLPTKELDPGDYVVLVRAENQAGNFDFHAVKVAVEEPSPPPPPPGQNPTMSPTITIRGTAKWGDGSAAAGAEVSIETPARSAIADDQGKFTFKDLPRASYSVKAKGTTGGIHGSGETKVDPGSSDAVDAVISLSALNH
ncbi:MAG: carboxypeptidase-like regulatory domain-containing protein [Thermoguttaceae bacterium]